MRFIAATRESIRRSANPLDKLYNSRAGLALYYRYDPRDLTAIARHHGIAVPLIHRSVFRRIRTGTEGYAPLNLPCDFRIATTHGADHGHIVPVETITQALVAKARPSKLPRSPLLVELALPITLRRFAHHAVVAATLGVAAVATYVTRNESLPTDADGTAVSTLAAATGIALPQIAIDFLVKPFVVYPQLVWLVLALLLAIWLLSSVAKRRLRRGGRQFWRALFSKS